MNKPDKKIKIQDQRSLLKALDWLYEKAVDGIGGTAGCQQLADDYMRKYCYEPTLAARKLVRAQMMKCTTSGFITSLGGLLSLPVALPANLSSVWYLQLQMIATIAVLGGYDPSRSEVKALCFACLAGSDSVDLVKQAAAQYAGVGDIAPISRIPDTALKALNRKLGLRFITRAGEKGMVKLGKMVPVMGGVVGGGIDLVSTRVTANTAVKAFIFDRVL